MCSSPKPAWNKIIEKNDYIQNDLTCVRSMANAIDLTVEFTFVRNLQTRISYRLTCSRGGLEMLFSDKKKHKISVPTIQEDGEPSTVGFLIRWLCENLMKDPRKEVFVLDDTV